MKSALMIAAALVIVSGSALARGGGEGNNTNCNGVGNPNSPCVPSGGQGGAGGQGGNAAALSAARAEARAAAIGVGVGVGGSANARGGNAQAGGGNATVSIQTGPGYVEARDRLRVPDATAPAIWSNNPCIVGLSGGVAVAGFGASIGTGIEDRDCTRRANAQHLIAMREYEWAREVMCVNTENRAAAIRAGRPCVADLPARPDAAGPVQAVAVTPSAPIQTRQRPAYCDRVPGIANSECQ